MTDRLSTLLRTEADEIAVPAAPAPAVLRQGRSLRRRHRLAQGAAAAAVVAVVATAGVAGTRLLGPGSGDGSGDGVAGAPDADGAFALGSTVYAGDTRVDVGEPVKVLYYTSAGVLVRSGDEPWTDAPGTSRYSLLREDGTLERLDLVLGDVVPSTDGTSSHVAYAHRNGAGWEVVVRDVGTDRVVGRAPVDATLDKRGWAAPPVELAGDKVYLATGKGILEVDWRTGRQRQVPGTPSGTLPDVAGDTWLDHTGTQIVVRRLADGKGVLTIPSKRFDYGTLSPDGSHVMVVDQSDEKSESRFTVYRVASGSSRTFRSPWYEQGWTRAGDLLRVDGSTVGTCDADTGKCSTQSIDLPPGGSQELKLAGKSYES